MAINMSIIKLPAILILAILCFASPGSAFYESAGDDYEVDARALLRVFSWYQDNPSIYPRGDDYGVDYLGRIITRAEKGMFRTEIDAYAGHTVATSIAQGVDVDRSSALSTYFRDDGRQRASFVFDRLNASITSGPANLTVGRQAIGLATCYYFTPNDFFAPFAANTFYRVYKPGVDAARLEVRTGRLSQLSFISALGYKPDNGDPSGWSDSPDMDKTSYIARGSMNVHDTDLSMLGGRLGKDSVWGGAVSGEIKDINIGIRLEGHYRWNDEKDNALELAGQLERRFENSLILKLEYFYHGDGADDPKFYTPGKLYMARRYGAIGASYEFSPLLTGEALALLNFVDNSQLYTVYAVYSLSDETDIAFGISGPSGAMPRSLLYYTDGSEFGAAPSISFTAEIRTYF